LWRSGTFLEPAGVHAELATERIGIVNVDQPMFRNSLPPSARRLLGRYVRGARAQLKDWFRKAAGRDERYDYLYRPPS